MYSLFNKELSVRSVSGGMRVPFRLLEGRMSIRWVTSLLGLLLTVTIMVTAGLSWNVYSSFTKMVEADVQYLNLMQVSRELLQSSYDLTRKAREYVNTGDEASERAYYDILAQRSGRVPRKMSSCVSTMVSSLARSLR